MVKRAFTEDGQGNALIAEAFDKKSLDSECAVDREK